MQSADLPTAPFFRELRADKERSKETPMKNTLGLVPILLICKERSKETPMKNTSLLLTVS